MSRMPFLLEQISATRRYTLQVLDHTDKRLWFQMPVGKEGPTTHIAWQVGHLVFAQYAHFVQRICGETPADELMIPWNTYWQTFGKGSTPQANAGAYPTVTQLMENFHKLHEHCLQRMARFPDDLLDQPVLLPHQIAQSRLDMVMWWLKHEMLHTGQIALLRRLLGEKPWR